MKTLYAMVLTAAMLGTGAAAVRAENVILINLFVVPAGGEAAALEHWEAARDFLSRQPGFVSTRLHRSIGSGAQFQLVNVAEWSSVEAFQAASQRMKNELARPLPEGLRFIPGLYQVIRK